MAEDVKIGADGKIGEGLGSGKPRATACNAWTLLLQIDQGQRWIVSRRVPYSFPVVLVPQIVGGCREVVALPSEISWQGRRRPLLA